MEAYLLQDGTKYEQHSQTAWVRDKRNPIDVIKEFAGHKTISLQWEVNGCNYAVTIPSFDDSERIAERTAEIIVKKILDQLNKH
jgi:hypothetical protein